MTTTSTVADRARLAWSTRLSSAIRAAFACAIVGGATLYGPKFLAHQIKFSAFSYLTTILIVSDASLGDTLRGCWHAFCATAQVVPLTMLWWWIVGPVAEIPPSMAAVGVAVAAFLVALPGFTHLTAKKIAFGQIVLVCTESVMNGGSRERFMQPMYIGASTALGAFASVLALMLPYPDLATYKVRELCRVYAENASKRINIYLRAFIAADEHTKMELISQAKPLTETGAKLLQSIKISQDGMQWEKPWRRISPGRRLERMELQMNAIEYSLLSSPAFPIQTNQEDLISDLLESVSSRLKEKIQQVSCFSPSNSMVDSETTKSIENQSLPFVPTFPVTNQGSVLFFFSCIDMLLNDTFTSPNKHNNPHSPKTWMQKLEFSVKCSLSLSLSVLCGLLFDPENGCWAGLAIAISFVKGRQAIFTMANARAQGTAMGSVYGVMFCFLFRYEEARLVAILPWIVVCSLIRYSKMYGQTGGVSAAIGALLILGRKNIGAPDKFAIVRLTEVFIGLSAYIAVELLIQPFRAATLAKNHLFVALHAVQGYVKETGSCTLRNNKTTPKFHELREKERKLDSLIYELNMLVGDAELEPDFWYLPFRISCYRKVVKSLCNVRDLLHFVSYNFEIVSEMLETSSLQEEFQERVHNELEVFQETLKQAISTEHIDGNGRDLEAGVLLQNKESLTVCITEQKEAELTTRDGDTEENKRKEMIMRRVNATGFCISSVLKELNDIQISVWEINQWENQSRQ